MQKQDGSGGGGRGNDMEWEFLPWEFECLDGFEAKALVGMFFLVGDGMKSNLGITNGEISG